MPHKTPAVPWPFFNRSIPLTLRLRATASSRIINLQVCRLKSSPPEPLQPLLSLSARHVADHVFAGECNDQPPPRPFPFPFE